MGHAASFTGTLTSFFLLPGEIVCNVLGVEKANNRDLLRMLINSFAWSFIGAVAVIFLV